MLLNDIVEILKENCLLRVHSIHNLASSLFLPETSRYDLKNGRSAPHKHFIDQRPHFTSHPISEIILDSLELEQFLKSLSV